MAIDNAEKRRSISGVGLEPFTAPGVTPIAVPDAQWRAQSGWSYSGLIPDPPSGGGGNLLQMTCGTLPTAVVQTTHISVGGGGGMS